MALRGSFRILTLYDVAEAIDLEKLRANLGERAGAVAAGFARRTPDYVRFEHPPIVEPVAPMRLGQDQALPGSLKYYSFGVVVAEVEAEFACGWEELIAQAARWLDTSALEPEVRAMVTRHLDAIPAAVSGRNSEWLQEQYLVVQLLQAGDDGQPHPAAATLLAEHGGDIARLLRGEMAALASKIADETVQASLSYYPTDLVVVGPSSALIYDRPEDAAAMQQILEYARMQLLEFRYYDARMSRQLAEVHTALVRSGHPLMSRWRLPGDAQRVNTLRLDVMDLTERVDSALKFVSDAYYARAYRLAATRMGVPDYRDLVDQKLATAGELYDFMVDQFNQARSFLLEVGVAILCLLDLLFWWKFK